MSNKPSSLSLIGAHAAGDFPLQSDWMAKNKFDSSFARAVHVLVYTATFVPVVVRSSWSRRQSIAFLVAIAMTHYVIDSQRWNDSVPIWYDQALHVIALALVTAIVSE